MIGQNIQIKLEGLLWSAFLRFCKENEFKNSREGIEGLIRQLPQYKQLLPANSNSIVQGQNQEPDLSEAISQPACAG